MGGCFTREVHTNMQMSENEEHVRGVLLVFINPNSGKGKGLEVFEEKVAPKLDKHRIKYEVILTEGVNHARNVLMTRPDLGSFHGVLILSGDGLVFEAINGILCRPDAFQILPNLPIGIIPSGSGNGLLCSVLSKHGIKMKTTTIMQNAIEIATSPSARCESVALYRVKTDHSEYASFLSIGWGLLADIDIESEKWRRSLGSHRFSVMGFVRSCNLRTYQGRLSYRYYKSREKEPTSTVYSVYDRTAQERIEGSKLPASIVKRDVPTQNTWSIHSPKCEVIEEITIEDTFINMYAVTTSHISADGPYAPMAKLEENKIHLSYILLKDIQSRVDILKFLLAIENGTHLDFPFVKHVIASEMKLEVISEGSYVVLDGEVIDTKSIKIESTDNHFSIFSTTE